MHDPITRRRFGMCWSLMPLLAMSACAAGPALPADAAALLAPTGRLRACIDLGNPILASRDASGTVAGVSVDLATALAQQLGLPLELIVVEAAAQSVEAVKTGAADIGSSRSTRTAAATASRSRRRT